jgi:hypothetical protein
LSFLEGMSLLMISVSVGRVVARVVTAAVDGRTFELWGTTSGVPLIGSAITTRVEAEDGSHIVRAVMTSSGAPLGDDPPVAHGHDVVRVPTRHVEVVQDDDDGAAVSRG